MNNSFIKTGYRNIIKDKLLSTVLVLGLIAGLTSVTLIALYLNFKFSYDNYHKDADKIYRIVSAYNKKSDIYELTLAKYTDGLNRLPGIHSSTKLFRAKEIEVKEGIRSFKIGNAFLADSGFFKVFTHKVLSGDVNRSLSTPYQAVITKTYALKIWGDVNAAGKVFNFGDKDYSVKAVIEDVPYNSHFRFDALLSFSSWQPLFNQCANEFYTYFRINNNADIQTVLNNANKACSEEYSKFFKTELSKVDLIFQPLRDIHLNSENFQFNIAEHGNKSLIKILFVIGLCIFIILVLNFVSLLTVKFQNRYKEIGIRKVMGANRQNLIFQFVGESVIVSVATALLSILTVVVLIKPFSSFFNINLSEYLSKFYIIAVFLIGTGVVVGLLSSLVRFINY